MTTPSEFLQFAREMGFDPMKSTCAGMNTDGYSSTGLAVLNNLCYLIEQMHRLKSENDHLRAHLDLMKQMDRFSAKHEEKRVNSIPDDDKTSYLSPSNSLKDKKYSSITLSISSRDRQGGDFLNYHDDSSSTIPIESDAVEGFTAAPAWNNWSKVRHALKFSLRRKTEPPVSPIGPIPAISISFESDDDHLQEIKTQKNKKKMSNTNQHLTGDETDHDEERMEDHRKRSHGGSFSGNESYLPMEEEQLLTRKQSKIAHYRRKLRSKLNTVKRQFGDQNVCSTPRLIPPLATFDEFGTGFNPALLTVQLAPAMTKSYQRKMRDWHSMQKSNFLVDYRRQSIVNKSDSDIDSRRNSLVCPVNQTSNDEQPDSPDPLIPDTKIDVCPTLSPNQRSLIVHQWRAIMSEEISLRIYSEYLHKKLHELNQLESDLKSLKTSIFSTNNQEYSLKHRSMTSIDQHVLDQYRSTDLPHRCRSYPSFISMPASWILAVQSAAYSDILDGTSNKTTDRAIIYNKNFFNQLNHFKTDRANFEQNTFKDFPLSTSSITNISPTEDRSTRARTRFILTRGHLRRLSLISPSEIPLNNPLIPIQTMATNVEDSSQIDLLTTNEMETNLSPLSSTTAMNKRFKRSRFDLKKTLQRSKSMCMTQFHSWLQRRRQQQQQNPFASRRISAVESKSSPTPKPFASPRLARFHQRIFKQHPSAPPATVLEQTPSIFPSPIDDSDQHFQKQESPVRIYFPARISPPTRHVRIIDNELKTLFRSKVTSPIVNRTIKIAIARERRESYAALSTILNNQ